jgi:hypothetical protein
MVRKFFRKYRKTRKKHFLPRIQNHNLINIEDLEDMQPEIIFYFSGDLDSAYHITQWIPYLKQTQYKLLIVTRSKKVIGALSTIDVPIIFLKKLKSLDAIPNSVKLAFYANNSANNTHFVRRLSVTHILLLHGESDKVSSISNVSRMYDKLFVAGQAAIDRYAHAGIRMDANSFEIIGRPQADKILTGQNNNKKTILYAPTWEGYFEDSSYSSLPWGKELIQMILEYDNAINIIFRAHPLNGTVDPRYREEYDKIITLLAGEQHTISYGDQSLIEDFNNANILLTDISAVLADFLQSEKPCIVWDRNNIGQKLMYETNMTTRGSYILNSESLNIKEILDKIFKQRDPLKAHRVQNKKYILGDFEGSASDKFKEKIDETYQEHAKINTF